MSFSQLVAVKKDIIFGAARKIFSPSFFVTALALLKIAYHAQDLHTIILIVLSNWKSFQIKADIMQRLLHLIMIRWFPISFLKFWSHLTVWPQPIWKKLGQIPTQHQSTYLGGSESASIEIPPFRPHFIKFSKKNFTIFTFIGTFTK